jgi:hypothetical protein
MSRTRSILVVVAFAVLMLGAVRAEAQPAPKFSFIAPEPKAEDAVEKKLSARGGLVQLAGNSKVLTATLARPGWPTPARPPCWSPTPTPTC